MLALAALAVASGIAQAGAPMARGQAPGWYRMTVGDFEVTALNDGTLELPVAGILTNTTPEKVKQALAKAYLETPLEVSVNAYLVNTGTKLVLIDTGAPAGMMGGTVGRLVANLKASGYKPEQIDEVYITHMHGDHVGGLVANDKPVFPNAIVRAGKAEGDYWLSPENMAKAPEEAKPYFAGAQAALKPYIAAGKYKRIEGDIELVSGVRAINNAGHTPGHTIYQIESKGQKMVFVGDLVHIAAVQLPTPTVTIRFDTDANAAMAQRKKVFADAAKQGYFVATAHFSFPGVGQLRAAGNSYTWVPTNYTMNR